MEWEFRISRCQLLYTRWINTVILFSTRNYIQYLVTNHNGKEYIHIHIYMCVCVCVCACTSESLCCTEEINTML